jgi:hypothetical protein
MAGRLTTFFDSLSERRALRRWAQAAAEADRLDIGALKSVRGRARQVRREVDRLLHVADARLAVAAQPGPALKRPLHADWIWRPALWSGPVRPAGLAAVGNRTGFGDSVTVFHDCKTSELTLRQVRNQREDDLAPFGCRMDVFLFDGSFLSLVIDLPEDAAQTLKLRHVVRLDAVIETERPIEIFARLNVRHGPNSDQIVREIPATSGPATAEFDLAYTKMNEKRVEKAWIDLIFEGPQFNQITLRDVTLSRRPRAEV